MNKLSSEKLKEYRYFSCLSDGAREIVARKLIPLEVIAGTQIIKEGASADFFYIIRSGEVDVIKSTRWGQAARIRTLKCGEGFGEMALLTCSPRDTSVIARTRVKLYKILKKDFEEIVRFDSAFTNMLIDKLRDFNRYNKLKTFQPFALLEPEKMVLLIEKLKERTYEAGDNIITQGGVGDAYYIIKSGRVVVTRGEGEREPEEIAVLNEGEGFGEEAIIREKGRNATVQALDNTTVMVLEKNDFEEILKKSFIKWEFPEEIPDYKKETSVFIDTRVTPEYEEEHIEGAVNIPIEVLRQKYEDLDPAQEYYTYCTSDSRGMAAAYLMKSMGFKVKAVRGGLSAWDGPVERGSNKMHTPGQ